MVARRLFGWLFFKLIFGLYRVSVIGVSFRILLPILLLFLTLFCPWLFLGAKVGTHLRTLLAFLSEFPVDAFL